MTLEQIYYIAEIIAVTGILISLLFVLRQLKQTQAQLERSEQSNILENAIASREFAMALARDGELSDIACSVLLKLLYAARLARWDLLRAIGILSSRITKWTPFLRQSAAPAHVLCQL